MKDIIAVLVHKPKGKQPVFHTEPLQCTPLTNLRCLINRNYSNPWSLIGLCEDYEKADKYIEDVKRKLKGENNGF